MGNGESRGFGRKILLIGTALCLTLSGCKQKAPQKEEKNATEEKTDTRWHEKWEVVYTDGENDSFVASMWMKCIIMIPENKLDSIVEVKEIKTDSQYKERLVKALFGDEAYLYDISHMTKSALKKELEDGKEDIADCSERIREIKEISYSSYGLEVDLAEARKKRKFLKEKISNIKMLLKQAPDVPVPVEDGKYECGSYLGYINGIAYRLDFNGQDSDGIVGWGSVWELDDGQRVTLEPVDSREVAPKEFSAADKIFYSGGHKDTENRCSLTEEEALEEAKDFLRKLSFDNMVETSVSDMVWTNDPDSQAGILEGYRFFFKTGMDGVPFSNKGASSSPIGEDSVEVCVAEDGVVAFRLNSPIEVKSITPDVQLLDLEDIKDMLRTQTAEYIKEIIRYDKYDTAMDFFSRYGSEIQIKKMELCYCRLENPEKKGEYTYVPAWSLDNFMVINAIDGSFIGT